MEWFAPLVVISLILMIFKDGFLMMLLLWIWYITHMMKTYGESVAEQLGGQLVVGIILLVIKLIGDLAH